MNEQRKQSVESNNNINNIINHKKINRTPESNYSTSDSKNKNVKTLGSDFNNQSNKTQTTK